MVVVDSRESALSETGYLVIPIQQGHITKDHIHAELGEMLRMKRSSRDSPEQTALFKSCGVADKYVVVAGRALDRARDLKLGLTIHFQSGTIEAI